MLIVGLTGGVASGKSVVSRVWKEEGAYVIDADRVARELVQPRTPAWKAVVKAFGKEILQEDGSIHRKKLAARVFSNPVERDLLNRILHPRITGEIDRRIKRIGQKGPKAIVVVDAALLVEKGYYRNVDKVVVVTSTRQQQIERLKRREQMGPEIARGVIDSQISGAERVKVADIIIRNEGSRKKTEWKAKEVFEDLKKAALLKDTKRACRQTLNLIGHRAGGRYKNEEDSKERV